MSRSLSGPGSLTPARMPAESEERRLRNAPGTQTARAFWRWPSSYPRRCDSRRCRHSSGAPFSELSGRIQPKREFRPNKCKQDEAYEPKRQ
jgi:hypothetical protein